MRNFIDAKLVKTKKEKVDKDKIDNFIVIFNDILNDPDNENGDESFSANTTLDDLPLLNEIEFTEVKQRALKMGVIS